MTPTNNDALEKEINPSEWLVATVRRIKRETPTVMTFDFELPRQVEHRAGQHYEIRLTAPDGYQAARLYSAASVPRGDNIVQLTVALLKDGEVSPYLHDHLQVGDQLELRGPLGRFFIWEPAIADPVLLVAGGSGIVPMRCILQAHAKAHAAAPIAVLYSAPTYDEIIYKDGLLTPGVPITVTLTRERPADWQGETGRIDAARLRNLVYPLPAGSSPVWYLCGSTPFVEAIADMLLAMNVPAGRIKAERFGGEDVPLT